MVSIGDKVRFIPAWDEPGCDRDGARNKRKLIGHVVYINEENRWFMVQYGKRKKVKLRECFNFQAIGSEVKILAGSEVDQGGDRPV